MRRSHCGHVPGWCVPCLLSDIAAKDARIAELEAEVATKQLTKIQLELLDTLIGELDSEWPGPERRLQQAWKIIRSQGGGKHGT